MGGGGELQVERVEPGSLAGHGRTIADDERLAAAALEQAVVAEEAVRLVAPSPAARVTPARSLRRACLKPM